MSLFLTDGRGGGDIFTKFIAPSHVTKFMAPFFFTVCEETVWTGTFHFYRKKKRNPFGNL